MNFNRKVAEFGECVWYLKPGTKGKYKWEERWGNGVWLGIRDESGETSAAIAYLSATASTRLVINALTCGTSFGWVVPDVCSKRAL